MASDQLPTNSLTFSIDEGKTWNYYYFSETDVWIYNINEISNNNFYIYGRDNNDRGIILGLDLSAVFDR